jgi:hypothetical protein
MHYGYGLTKTGKRRSKMTEEGEKSFAEAFQSWKDNNTCSECGKFYRPRVITGKYHKVVTTEDGKRICPFCYWKEKIAKEPNYTSGWKTDRRTDVFGACRDGLD